MNKEQTYQELLTVMPVVLADTAYEISLLANFVALIHQMLPDVSWTGIYLNKEEILILGPFQGKVACTVIPFNRGVAGRVRPKEEQSSFPMSIGFRATSPAMKAP